MSETVTRQRPSVDLDAFERRFRQTQHSAHDDDPLAELARIVGDQHDPYGDVFAQQPAAAPPYQDTSHQDRRAPYAPHGRQEPSLGGPGPRFSADFAAIEAGLRGAQAQPQLHPQVAPGHDIQPDYAEPDYAFPPEPEVGAMPGPADWEQVHEPARSPGRAPARQKPVYGIAAAIVLAVAGIGVAFAYKGTGSSPREIKTIMAASGPTKIQPPADAQADAANQDAAAQGQTAPTKLVSREEQPVDLQQAVQDNSASRKLDASSVPVPPPGTMSPDYGTVGGQSPDAASIAGSASPSYSDQGFGVGMPLPKKVRSVSVKPDGTIVPGSQDAGMAPAPARNATPDRIGALAEDASPSLAAQKRSAKTKSTSRVATAAPPPADAASETDGTPAPKPTRAAQKAKPVQVATAETGTEQVQANDANDAKPAGSGIYAVQLAAPGSEDDARSATTRLLKKYSGALHGRRLGFHRAESNGHMVYRVRVSSLSKEDATSLCSKLKSDGGSCFVAKN